MEDTRLVVLRKSDLRYLQERTASGWSTNYVYDTWVDDIENASLFRQLPKEVSKMLQNNSDLIKLTVTVTKIIKIVE